MKLLLIGAGRTGSHAAKLLAQKLSGKDQLAIVDRDALEESNLSGCALYLKKDVGRLKAALLADKISSKTKCKVIAFSEHLTLSNIGRIARGAQVVLDCTDNWQTRILINEHCWKKRIPWVYAGAIKNRAMCTAIAPRKTACFACWAKKPTAIQSCSEQGVEQKALEWIAQVQVGQALLLASGKKAGLEGKLLFFDSENNFERIVRLAKNPACEFCALGKSLYQGEGFAVLCGGKEWLFRNDLKAESASGIYSKLEGLERKIVGGTVKVKIRGSEATVLPNGSVMVRSKNERHAAAANQAIAQKIC